MIPLLIDQYRIRPQSNPRQFILNSLNKLVHAGLYGFTEVNGKHVLKIVTTEKYILPVIFFTVSQSGVALLTPTLLELYLEVLKETDTILCNLSLQGLTHFIGICLNQQDLEKVNQALLDLLQKSSTLDSVIVEIGHFFCKSAEKNESWFIEQVLVKLLDIAVSSNLNFLN